MGWSFTHEAVWVSGHPGLSRSRMADATFVPADQGLPDTDVHASEVGVGVLYGASPSVGALASTDGGRSWQVRSDQGGHGFFGRILVDPANSDHILATDACAGVVQSSDGGRTWHRLGSSPAAAWLSGSGAAMETLVASGPRARPAAR